MQDYSFYLIFNIFDKIETNDNEAPYLVCAVWVSYSVYTIRVTVIPMTSFHMLVVVGPICEFSTTFSTAVRTFTSVLPAVNLMRKDKTIYWTKLFFLISVGYWQVLFYLILIHIYICKIPGYWSHLLHTVSWHAECNNATLCHKQLILVSCKIALFQYLALSLKYKPKMISLTHWFEGGGASTSKISVTTKVAPKLMTPILLCWPTTTEADVGDMAVEVEPSLQYSVKFCCRATDDSRGAVWQNCIWHGSVYEAKVCNWIPPCGKNWTQWHSSTHSERLRRPNSGC